MIALSTSTTSLPLDFVPSPHSVIIGRSRECKEAMGNKRLRILVQSFLAEYSQAINRTIKSELVSKIVAMVKEACPHGGFVKKVVNGTDIVWVEVSDSVAREKVGYVFRDLLADRYRSSSKSKSLKRQLDHEKAYKKGTKNFQSYMKMVCSRTPKEGKIDLPEIPTSLFQLKEEPQKNMELELPSSSTRRSSLRASLRASFSSLLLPTDLFDLDEEFGEDLPEIKKELEVPSTPLFVPSVRRQSEIRWMEIMNLQLLE